MKMKVYQNSVLKNAHCISFINLRSLSARFFTQSDPVHQAFLESITETSHIRHVKGPAGEGWPHCDHSPSSLICCHYLYEHFKIKNKQRGRTAMWQSGIEGFGGKVREWGDILDTLCFIMSFIIPVSDEQHALCYPACSPRLSSCATPTVCTWIQILYF